MKKLLLFLSVVSFSAFASVEMGEDLKGDCADGIQKTRSTASSDTSSSSTPSSTSSSDSAGSL